MQFFEKINTNFKKIIFIALKLGKKIAPRHIIIAVCALVAIISAIFIILYNRPDESIDRIKDVASITNDDTSSDSLDSAVDIPVNFEELQKVNSDIYAWITIPGTSVDYPILRSEIEDFYLTHNVEKKESAYGSLYTQNYNSDDFNDFNTVIYGHNMINGTMFGDLDKYRKESFFNENQTIYIYLPNRVLTYRIFAAYVYDSTHILLNYTLTNVAQRVEYIDDIYSGKYKGNIRKDMRVTASDRLITLSTCNSNIAERYLVQAVLINDTDKEG